MKRKCKKTKATKINVELDNRIREDLELLKDTPDGDYREKLIKEIKDLYSIRNTDRAVTNGKLARILQVGKDVGVILAWLGLSAVVIHKEEEGINPTRSKVWPGIKPPCKM